MLLDGKQLSETIKIELASAVEDRRTRGLKIPHLAAVLVGQNPASHVYVNSKIRSCEQVGFKSSLIPLPEETSEANLLEVIQNLNHDPDVDGFIVQLPLPKHINAEKVTLAIDPSKDVDGFHPVNFGRMAQGLDAFLPATPMGILEMIRRYEIPTAGRHAVVVGRSNIVGTPMSLLLSRKGYPGDCTVTLTHSRTRDLPAEVRRADIVVAAIGIPEFIQGDWLREDAVVIDVGINRVADASKKSGFRLVGDVHFPSAEPRCSYITPVPGGVGLMTVTALLMNTLKACRTD
ncbi:MAG: bifunctional methylenetetrahydrofolate dehydrogenase/methenyltetrahydrofolate cyclohydrolase FolD [Saprospiraceae bacterium]|nr:bifunctional methylenetetrahydrofolate dehydrogenase/methenyltetrahydrofolate cyclohydrolase FolD [Saprospiraceae bacterium]